MGKGGELIHRFLSQSENEKILSSFWRGGEKMSKLKLVEARRGGKDRNSGRERATVDGLTSHHRDRPWPVPYTLVLLNRVSAPRCLSGPSLSFRLAGWELGS